MIASLFLTLFSAPAAAAPAAAVEPALLSQDVDQEYQTRLAAAGDDVDKLMELSVWCKANSKYAESRKVLKSILEIDADNEAAHKALNHHFYDGQWFDSYLKVSDYKRAEEEKMRAKGLVRLGEEWVSAADAPYLRLGWVKTEGGDAWMSPSMARQMATKAEMEAKGYLQFDYDWVSPEDWATKYEQEKLWKVGDEWMPIDEANAVHANINTPWRRPTVNFTLITTLPRTTTDWVVWYADATVRDLKRIFGDLQPAEPGTLVVLNSLDQYNKFATGDAADGGPARPASELSGFSSLHYAFQTEGWIDNLGQDAEYRSAGVAYWDLTDEALEPFGQFAIRFAAALAWIESIDPSLGAVGISFEGGQNQFRTAEYWAEKRVPLWLRYGAASYCDRYFTDTSSDNPSGIRNWALSSLENKGGPRPLADVFTFLRDVNNQPTTEALIGTSGALVAFIIDGKCEPVIKAHTLFKAALKAGEDTTAAATALQQAILDNEEEFHVHIGM